MFWTQEAQVTEEISTQNCQAGVGGARGGLTEDTNVAVISLRTIIKAWRYTGASRERRYQKGGGVQRTPRVREKRGRNKLQRREETAEREAG